MQVGDIGVVITITVSDSSSPSDSSVIPGSVPIGAPLAAPVNLTSVASVDLRYQLLGGGNTRAA